LAAFEPSLATSDSATIWAALIAVVGVFVTQLVVLHKARQDRRRADEDRIATTNERLASEKFRERQDTVQRDHERELADVTAELKRLGELRTRWDPVRFEIYVEAVALAMQRYELQEEWDRIATRQKSIDEDLKTTGDSVRRALLDKSNAENAGDREARGTAATKCHEDWNVVRGKIRMISSIPVWEALNSMGESLRDLETKNDARGGAGLYGVALENFREAVRVELGSDHYAEEPTKDLMT
jgi:hypothetical protein